MALIQLIYGSSAVVDFTKARVLELLRQSRASNEREALTGILLYRDGNFLQVLEGEESVVMKLFEKISADRRHGGVQQLLKSVLVEREFAGWSMAFRDISDEALKKEPAFSEFLNVPSPIPSSVDEPSRAQKLLVVFRTVMR